MPRDLKFPEHCKGRILCSFGGHGMAYGHQRTRPITQEELRRTLRTKTTNYAGWQDFMLVTLNVNQIPRFENVLFEFDFKCVNVSKRGNKLYIRKLDDRE